MGDYVILSNRVYGNIQVWDVPNLTSSTTVEIFMPLHSYVLPFTVIVLLSLFSPLALLLSLILVEGPEEEGGEGVEEEEGCVGLAEGLTTGETEGDGEGEGEEEGAEAICTRAVGYAPWWEWEVVDVVVVREGEWRA